MANQFVQTRYAKARAAFRTAAEAAGFSNTPVPVDGQGPDGESLTIDIAVKSNGPIRRAVVISSGTHGIEGYFGSAVQQSLLHDRLKAWTPGEGEAVVMVHAVNPWGMAHGRRVDAEGIDLNRNFVRQDKAYAGVHDLYRQIDPLMNPETRPGGLDLFLPRVATTLVREGFTALKDAIARGQYEFPKGLFFGGTGPSASLRALAEALPPILGKAERVVHLDLHTGSGKWGTYALVVDMPEDDPRAKHLAQAYGAPVQPMDPSGVLYEIQGALGPWLQELMPEVVYDTMLAEFGTYNNITVLLALRWENRAYNYAHHDASMLARGRAKLMETFCPAKLSWRSSCVTQARGIVSQAFVDVFSG